MVIFHRYSIRLKPGEPLLILYAPDWEALKQNQEYQSLAEMNRPCKFQVEDVQLWYRNGESNREATDEEIARWTKDDAYLMMPDMEFRRPLYYYPSFGDEAVLTPLKEKLRLDYEEYLDEWKTVYAESRNALYDRLGEISTVQTVYHNLLNCCDAYPQEYMKALSEEEAPLRILSFFHEQSGCFSIEPEAEDILAIMEGKQDRFAKYYRLDSRADGVSEHDRLMEILDENLDREYQGHLEKWDALDFDGLLEHSVEIYTLRQLYHTLRNEKHFYSADQLDIAAQLAEPMAYDRSRLVGEREMSVMYLDDIQKILPQMYPDTELAPDPWNTSNDTPEEESESMNLTM